MGARSAVQGNTSSEAADHGGGPAGHEGRRADNSSDLGTGTVKHPRYGDTRSGDRQSAGSRSGELQRGPRIGRTAVRTVHPDEASRQQASHVSRAGGDGGEPESGCASRTKNPQSLQVGPRPLEPSDSCARHPACRFGVPARCTVIGVAAPAHIGQGTHVVATLLGKHSDLDTVVGGAGPNGASRPTANMSMTQPATHPSAHTTSAKQRSPFGSRGLAARVSVRYGAVFAMRTAPSTMAIRPAIGCSITGMRDALSDSKPMRATPVPSGVGASSS